MLKLKVIIVIAIIINLFPVIPVHADTTNLAYQKPYSINFQGACPTYPDTNGCELTDGIYASNSYADSNWVDLYQANENMVYITVDLRYISSISGASINFLQNTGAGVKYPGSVKFSYSVDGIYYKNLGDGTPQSEVNSTKRYSLTLETVVNAKYIRAIITENIAGDLNFTDELQVQGTCSYNNSTQFEVSSYSSSIVPDSSYPDSGSELTNGIISSGGYQDSAWTGWYIDPSTTSPFFNITFDMGTNKNISEVAANFLSDNHSGISVPTVGVYYSTDGTNYIFLDYFNSRYELRRDTADIYNNVFICRLSVPYTITARYIRLKLINTGWTFCDEAYIYGQPSAIPISSSTPATTPSPPSSANVPSSYANVAIGKTYTSSLAASATYLDIGGSELTDGKFGDGRNYNDARWSGYFTDSSYYQVVDLGQPYSSIQGVSAEFMQNVSVGIYYPLSVSFSYSSDGTNYTSLGNAVVGVEIENKKVYKLTFSSETVRYIKMTVNVLSPQWVFEDEIQVFNGDVHKAALKGGFFQIPIGSSGGVDSLTWYSENNWQKIVQDMYDMGMTYIVIQFTANSDEKKTLYPDTSISGYSQVSGMYYGGIDPIETILAEADKYKMKVMLGGITSYGFYSNIMNLSAAERSNWINNEVSIGNQVNDELYSRYGSHSSFYGFYFADEMCDYWLSYNGGQGVEDARALYGGMSNHIRQLYPNAKLMISPATWLGNSASQYAIDLYNTIVNGYGGKPIVDIIAEQDSLGARWSGNPPAYTDCEERMQAVSNMMRSMEVDYWLDTEVFEDTALGDYNFHSMDMNEMSKSLAMESKYTNVCICFDIPHYIDPQLVNQRDATQTYYDYRNYIGLPN